MKITIRHGFAEADRAEVAQLYWQAFGLKLGRVLRPEPKALAFVQRVMRADHALAAYDEAGRLLGVAGFKSPRGAFVGGRPSDLVAIYGRFGGYWRATFLNLLSRDVENARFLMDGLFVREECRGMGIGSALLQAVVAEAARRGYAEVRLDVVDTNPRARALYERHGFRALFDARLGPLRLIFGFVTSTAMVRAVD
jgi:ribosomal protein S18 acetylase RimI-like enzyme